MDREEAWEALTRSEQLSKWFEAEVQIDPRPRGLVKARSLEGADRQGVVVAADRPFRLVLAWESCEDPWGQEVPPSRMEFTLQADGERTILTVVESPLPGWPLLFQETR